MADLRLSFDVKPEFKTIKIDELNPEAIKLPVRLARRGSKVMPDLSLIGARLDEDMSAISPRNAT